METAIREIEQRRAARAQAVEDVKSAMQLVEKVEKMQRGLSHPKLTGELSFADKRAVLDALHVKAVATEDGNIRISGFISGDVLAALGMIEDENGVLSKDRQGDALAHFTTFISPSTIGPPDEVVAFGPRGGTHIPVSRR